LTAKEFQTLEYFMKHERQVVTQPANHESTEVGAEPTNNAVAAQIRLRRKLSEVGVMG